MKIAVYLSGQSRLLDEGGPWTRIVDLFDEHDVDFYFHFWENEEYTQDHILNIFNPVKYKFEPQIDFTTSAEYLFKHLTCKKLQQRRYFNMMSFYYSFAQARSIVPLEKYDYVCKTRTDIPFKKNLNSVIGKAKDAVVVHPAKKHPDKRLNDFCFLSTAAIFSKVLSVAELALTPQEYVVDYQQKIKNIRFTSHTYLAYAFERYNIKHTAVDVFDPTFKSPRN